MIRDALVERKLYVFATTSSDDDDWLSGGQVFADTGYKFGRCLVGVNGKYQLTQDFKDAGFDSNNWRLGAQIGVMF
jgi:hypothetical protein